VAVIFENRTQEFGNGEVERLLANMLPAELTEWMAFYCSHNGSAVYLLMRIIARRTLREFWERHPDTEQALRAWYLDAQGAVWKSPADIKRMYANASILGQNRVVFNIKGNRYRLVVAINYAYQISYIRFVGTHEEYDRIDAGQV